MLSSFPVTGACWQVAAATTVSRLVELYIVHRTVFRLVELTQYAVACWQVAAATTVSRLVEPNTRSSWMNYAHGVVR